MNKEEVTKHWHIIEAFRNGKKVQYQSRVHSETWIDTDNPSFAFHYEYRIKPEKVKAWLNIYNRIDPVLHKTKELADSRCSLGRIACIKIEYDEGEGL